MTAYKLVKCQFKKLGLQSLVEHKVMGFEERVITKFHRQVFVWMDKWYGLSLDDVRAFEKEVHDSLEEVS